MNKDTVITSSGNPTVKQLRKLLTSGKARREADRYVAEGIHLARSFIDTRQTPLMYALAVSASKNPEVAQLAQEFEDTPAQRIILADSLFESLAHIHAPVGILIVFSPVQFVSNVGSATGTTVLLEDVQDPGNIGTILRTAAAVGVHDILLSPGCASPWSPKALRAGMGAQFGMRLRTDANLTEHVKASANPVLATTLSPRSQSLYRLDLRRPVTWLFGNEGQGISEPLLRQVAAHITIPQSESSVESLNVAAAAAVCLYEQYRQSNI